MVLSWCLFGTCNNKYYTEFFGHSRKLIQTKIIPEKANFSLAIRENKYPRKLAPSIICTFNGLATDPILRLNPWGIMGIVSYLPFITGHLVACLWISDTQKKSVRVVFLQLRGTWNHRGQNGPKFDQNGLKNPKKWKEKKIFPRYPWYKVVYPFLGSSDHPVAQNSGWHPISENFDAS